MTIFKVMLTMFYWCVLVVFNVSHSYAEDDVIVIEGTDIRGNQEQPKILYIIPWQKPLDRAALESGAIKLIGSDLLQPLYREELVRRLEYEKTSDASLAE